MSSVTISGDTSGSIILQAPSVAGSTTLTLPTTSGTVLTNASSVASSQLPTGSVLQVLQATKTDTASSTNTSFADITGLSASITPRSTSSRILIMAFVSIGSNFGNGGYPFLRIARGGSAIFVGDAAGSRTQTTAMMGMPTGTGSNAIYKAIQVPLNYVDSPSSTSSLTYSIQAATPAGSETYFINRTSDDSNSNFIGRFTSSIILMEIA